MVWNVYNPRLRKLTDYMKENIDQSMFFVQVVNNINEDELLFFQHEVMEHY